MLTTFKELCLRFYVGYAGLFMLKVLCVAFVLNKKQITFPIKCKSSLAQGKANI